MRLWRGLWYTLYLADRAPVQEEVSRRIAGLVWCVCGTPEDDAVADSMYLNMDADMTTKYVGAGELDEGEGNVAIKEEEEDVTDAEDPPDSDSSSDNSINHRVDDDGDAANFRHCQGAHLVAVFLATFLRTASREWSGLDQHRLDKFYTLVRYVIRECYVYLYLRGWPMGLMRLMNDALYDECLGKGGMHGVGLKLHVCDLALGEIVRAGAGVHNFVREEMEEEDEAVMRELKYGGGNFASSHSPTTQDLLVLLEPFMAVVQTDTNDAVHRRVVDKVLLEFLKQHSTVSDLALRESSGELQHMVLHTVDPQEIANLIFDAASDKSTLEKRRPGMYMVYKMYANKIKDSNGRGKMNREASMTTDMAPTALKGRNAADICKSGHIDTKKNIDASKKNIIEKSKTYASEKTGDRVEMRKQKKDKKREPEVPISINKVQTENIDVLKKDYSTVVCPKQKRTSTKESKERRGTTSEKIILQKQQKKVGKGGRENLVSKTDQNIALRERHESGGEVATFVEDSNNDNLVAATLHPNNMEVATKFGVNKFESSSKMKKKKNKNKSKKKSKIKDVKDLSNTELPITPPRIDAHAMAEELVTPLSKKVKDVPYDKDVGITKIEKRQHRVKFGTTCRAKSYTASMKDLRNGQSPAPDCRPTLGILQKKPGTPIVLTRDYARKQQKQKHPKRKRAVDYF